MQNNQETQNLQDSILFNDDVPYIETSSNDSNIVHKKSATSIIYHNIENKINSTSKYLLQLKNKFKITRIKYRFNKSCFFNNNDSRIHIMTCQV
ncbi:hypothetical protein [Sulfurimonas sp.]